MPHIVLASGSPRRQELLRRIGVTEFDIRVPRTDEHYPAGLTPQGVVEYISREKADAAVKLCTPEEVVITADTMVFLDDQRLGKPRDEAHALEMLTALQGRRHTVCTGVTVRQGNRSLTESESTAVIFRAHGQGRGLRRAGQGRSAGGAAGGGLFQRHGPPCPSSEPDAGAVRHPPAVSAFPLIFPEILKETFI